MTYKKQQIIDVIKPEDCYDISAIMKEIEIRVYIGLSVPEHLLYGKGGKATFYDAVRVDDEKSAN